MNKRTTKLFQIEDNGKTAYWSDDEDAKLKSLERKSGNRNSNQESKMERSQRGEEWENSTTSGEIG